MFLGTIEPVVRNFLAAHADAFRGKVIAVGCSGNFTSERVLWEATGGEVRLFSNDVSLYSCLIGAQLAGQPFDLAVVEEPYQWLERYFDAGGWRRVAAFLVFYRMLEFERQNNAYRVRMWKQHFNEFERLVEATEARLQAIPLQIAGFYPGDIFEFFQWMGQRGEEVIYTSYMPFFKGGYERLYRRVGEIFQWDAPTYPMLDDERRVEVATWCEARPNVTLLNFPLPGREPAMLGHTQRNVHVFMYSNVLDRTALYRREHPDAGVRFELLTEGDIPDPKRAEVRVYPVSPVHIQPYKAYYLARNIDFSMGMYGFGVALNGKVIGFLEFSLGTAGTGSDWYLFSDFAVGMPFHARQSKLVAMLALCEEVRRRLEVASLRRRSHVATTAWTKKPVSMKYRGVFELVKRDEVRGMLNYRAAWSGLNAQETYQKWLTKYAKG